MDSMRSLNTSLPTPYSSRPPPPEQLLQAFRTAALSVTNLYKSAVTDQDKSRAAGYQDALDDLLSFLDRENLGLQDGEGWRVRQWATERYDGTANHQGHSESEDTRSDVGREVRTATLVERPVEQLPTKSDRETQTVPIADVSSTEKESKSIENTPIFRFTGCQSEQPSDDMQTDERPASPNQQPESSSGSPPAPIRVELVNVGNRSHRSGVTRHVGRSSNRDFTFTAGTKRKLQFPDFFDISNIGPEDDGGEGKRGRFA